MANILRLNSWRVFRCASSQLSSWSAGLTQQEVATVLRPLYFAVHPDLFYQHPKEKEINENSLKQMNYYLETILKNLPTNPTSLTFCLRSGSQSLDRSASFKHVNVKLLGKDIHRILHSILSSCHLSTAHLDTLRRTKECPPSDTQSKTSSGHSRKSEEDFHATWWNEARKAAEDIEQRIRNEPDIDFRSWLNNNLDKALRLLRASQPLREETERLSDEMRAALQLKEVVWNCGWGITHFRGCLQSFKGLATQHPEDMKALKGRTLVFGRQTGVSFEGHVILSSEDVRNNWLDMIRSVDQFDTLLSQIPGSETSLSEVLRGIQVDHRKFRPTVMVQPYVQQLQKLTAALYRRRWVHGYPAEWPRRMDDLQIVVECEAGPLMLSPTGQFIVPASCPAFVLVDFISKNMTEARRRLQLYTKMKGEEHKLHAQCMHCLGLESLSKDDNITPDRMVRCLRRILMRTPLLESSLLGTRVRVSHYYCIMQDGEVCIPWDWKDCPTNTRKKHKD